MKLLSVAILLISPLSALAGFPGSLEAMHPNEDQGLLHKVVLSPSMEACGNEVLPKGSVHEIARRHTVRLRYEGVHHCTGTVTGLDEVTTAAHCVPRVLSVSAMSVEVYDMKSGTYKRYRVEKVKSTTSQARPDIALIKLKGQVSPENVIEWAARRCDDARLVQAGFGLTEQGTSAKCLRFAEYQSVAPPTEMHGVAVPLAMSSVFYAKPRDSNNMACTGDSGGPIYCKVRGQWAYAGLFTAVSTENAKDKVWAGESKACNDFNNPNRAFSCVRMCRRAEAGAGYWIYKIRENLETIRLEMRH